MQGLSVRAALCPEPCWTPALLTQVLEHKGWGKRDPGWALAPLLPRTGLRLLGLSKNSQCTFPARFQIRFLIK